MSQKSSTNAAFRTLNVQQRPVVVDRCSFRETFAQAFNITNSNRVTLSDNVVYKTHRNAVKVQGADTLKITNNLFIFNDNDSSGGAQDHQVAVDLCTG